MATSKKTLSTYKPVRDSEYPVGIPVILVSNEASPPIVGTLIRWEPFTQSGQPTPVVKCSQTGCEHVALGMLLPYSNEMLAMVTHLEMPLAWYLFRDAQWLWADIKRAKTKGAREKEQARIAAAADKDAKDMQRDLDRSWKVGFFWGVVATVKIAAIASVCWYWFG